MICLQKAQKLLCRSQNLTLVAFSHLCLGLSFICLPPAILLVQDAADQRQTSMVHQHRLELEDRDRRLREAWDMAHSQTHDRNRYCPSHSQACLHARLLFRRYSQADESRYRYCHSQPMQDWTMSVCSSLHAMAAAGAHQADASTACSQSHVHILNIQALVWFQDRGW